LLWYSFRK